MDCNRLLHLLFNLSECRTDLHKIGQCWLVRPACEWLCYVWFCVDTKLHGYETAVSRTPRTLLFPISDLSLAIYSEQVIKRKKKCPDFKVRIGSKFQNENCWKFCEYFTLI